MTDPVPDTGSTDADGDDRMADQRPEIEGIRHEVADRIDRWLVPAVHGVRRTLWVPVAAGTLAVALAVAAAIAWQGADADGLFLAAVVAVVVALPVLGIVLFVRLLGELEHLPDTVRAMPAHVGELKDDLGSTRSELGELRQAGLFGLPGALRWLRRTLGRLDALGVAGVAAAVTALHPLRLAWILLLCWLSLIALPAAALALLLALTI